MSYEVPPVKPCIEGQPSPPPPLSPRELLGHNLSVEENMEQFREPDSFYPGLVFNEKAYRKVLKSRPIADHRLPSLGRQGVGRKNTTKLFGITR